MMSSMDCILVHKELVSDMVIRSARVQKDKQAILASGALYMLIETTRP